MDAATAFPSMSSEEVELLNRAAVFAYGNFVTFTCAFVFYGLYFVVNLMAVFALLQRPTKSRSTWVLLLFLALMFLATTLNNSMFGALNFLTFRKIFIEDPNVPIMERITNYQASDTFVKLTSMNAALASYSGNLGMEFIISDALTIWRAVTICDPPAYIGRALYLLLVTSIAIWIVCVYYAVEGLQQGNTATWASDAVRANLEISGSALSIGVNVLSTAMVSIKAYRHRLLAKDVSMQFRSSKVLVFLAESGFVYALAQIIAFGTSLNAAMIDTPLYTAISFWSAASSFLSTVITPIIILIVTHKVSLANSFQLATITGTDVHRPMGSIAFAPMSHSGSGTVEVVSGVDVQMHAEKKEKTSESDSSV